MVMSSPFQCLTLSLLLIPPLLITTYFLAAFPNPPAPIHIHKSLSSLPPHAKSWSIYPEDFYPDGHYVSLPFGRTRYWLLGPENGQKVVLIHGLSIPALIWKDVAPSLASRGYRVLVYDLYGRGYSDAPQTTYDVNLYTIQLALLMQHLKWEKAIITGLSMGGGIAVGFTAQFPHLVSDKVVLIASAGLMDASDISRTAKFMSSPLVQTLTSSGPVRKYLQRLIMNDSTPPPNPFAASMPEKKSDPFTELVRLQSAHLTGYNAALSSSLRDGPVRGQASSLASEAFANKAGRGVLILYGTRDNTVPPRYGPRMLSLLPPGTHNRSKIISIEGAGHDLTLSHGHEVTQHMLDFFEQKTERESY